MSYSTVPICGACWNVWSYLSFDEIREPFKFIDPAKEVCSFCGGWAEQGIYVRAQTEKLPFYGLEEPPHLPEDAS